MSLKPPKKLTRNEDNKLSIKRTYKLVDIETNEIHRVLPRHFRMHRIRFAKICEEKWTGKKLKIEWFYDFKKMFMHELREYMERTGDRSVLKYMHQTQSDRRNS